MRSLARLASLITALAFLLVPAVTAAQDSTPVATPSAATPVGSPVASPAGASPVASPVPALSSNATVFAKGLNSPRGLKFGPDGSLYVAEAGTGGTTSTNGQCTQVIPPIGPYTGGKTARVSRIYANGLAQTVADGLPSTRDASGADLGAADIAFIGNTPYVLIAGGGCSHGNPDAPNGVYQLNPDGSTKLVADLSKFNQANPVAKPSSQDFEPDETWYSMVAVDNALYVVGPNGGQIDKVDPATGTVTRLIDISATQGHVVPTAIAVGKDGNFYVANLGTVPIAAGKQFVYKVTPDGQISTYATGLTAVLGLAFGPDGKLYALEMSGPSSGQMPFTPNSGRVVEVGTDGTITPVATGFNFPTGMTFGPDGKIYVSNNGFGTPPGSGEIVVINMPGSSS